MGSALGAITHAAGTNPPHSRSRRKLIAFVRDNSNAAFYVDGRVAASYPGFNSSATLQLPSQALFLCARPAAHRSSCLSGPADLPCVFGGLSLGPLTALPARRCVRRGYDPRDGGSFFQGDLAFLALYSVALSSAQLLAIASNIPSFRDQFANATAKSAEPLATVTSAAGFNDAVNNAVVVNFAFGAAGATGVTYNATTWYIYRPDQAVVIDGSGAAPAPSGGRRLESSSSSPRRSLLLDSSTWPVLSAPSGLRVLRVDASSVTIRNIRFVGVGVVPSDSAGGVGACLLLMTTGAVLGRPTVCRPKTNPPTHSWRRRPPCLL